MAVREPLISRTDLAEYLGVPVLTVTQWASKGTGPAYVKVGIHARYRWSDVEQWLAEKQQHGRVPA